MIRARRGKVIKIGRFSSSAQKIEVICENKNVHAICFPELTGRAVVGDWVILNTNAIQLRLGTGGYHFVIWIEGKENLDWQHEIGHIIKMRYTPFQIRCQTAEEETSKYHETLKELGSIGSIPTVVCELHSMIAPVVAGIKETAGNNTKVAYIMTDGGALPASFSRLSWALQKEELIDSVITCGHAFGGDIECINIYSALCVAKKCVNADVIVVSMGPGQAGTSTRYGFSGIEQGITINAIYSLGGIPICAPRISFFDPRDRHFGISHHTITILSTVVLGDCIVVLPEMGKDRLEFIKEQLSLNSLDRRYIFITENGYAAIKRLLEHGIRVTTMGRDFYRDPEFFLASGAAGVLAGKIAMKRKGDTSKKPLENSAQEIHPVK